MATDIKRMRYFDGLFLKEQEFQLDQEYNLRMRRMHNRHLHGRGIVWGLEIATGPSPTQVLVQPGLAIDLYNDPTYDEEHGREILVGSDLPVDLSGFNPGDGIYVWISYEQRQEDVVADRGGSEPIHWTETGTVTTGLAVPTDPTDILLGKVIMNSSVLQVETILEEENDASLRTYISSPVAGGGGTSSSSSGGKNYVRNPGVESSSANWTSATSLNLKVDRTASVGEVLAGSFSFQVNSTGGVQADTDYITIGLTPFDEEDKNQLCSVELSYKGLDDWEAGQLKVVVHDITNGVDIIPNPQLIPGGQGKYRGVFTTTDSLSYELRLVANVSSQVFSVSVDSVRVGPNDTTIGPAIGGWTPYDLQITGVTSDPTKADNPDVDQAHWRRVGDSMEIVYTYYQTNSTGSAVGDGAYLFGIPDGYTIDASKTVINTGVIEGVVGSATADNGPQQSAGVVKVYDDKNLALVPDSSGTALAHTFVSHVNFPLSSAPGGYSFRATVPIAQWQSDIVLSESRTEFVSNDDDSNGDNTSNFVTGEAGSPVPLVTGSPAKKRVQFSRPYKHYKLEVQPNGAGRWFDLGSSEYGSKVIGPTGTPTRYGMALKPVSDTELDVSFAKDGVHFTDSAFPWTDENMAGTRWRVVGSDNPAFVETAPRQILAAESATHEPVTDDVYFPIMGNSVILPPGEWLLSGSVHFTSEGGGASYQYTEISWSGQNGDGIVQTLPPLAEITSGYFGVLFNSLVGDVQRQSAPTVVVKTTTNLPVYLGVRAIMVNSSPSRITTYITAVRLS